MHPYEYWKGCFLKSGLKRIELGFFFTGNSAIKKLLIIIIIIIIKWCCIVRAGCGLLLKIASSVFMGSIFIWATIKTPLLRFTTRVVQVHSVISLHVHILYIYCKHFVFISLWLNYIYCDPFAFIEVSKNKIICDILSAIRRQMINKHKIKLWTIFIRTGQNIKLVVLQSIFNQWFCSLTNFQGHSYVRKVKMKLVLSWLVLIRSRSNLGWLLYKIMHKTLSVTLACIKSCIFMEIIMDTFPDFAKTLMLPFSWRLFNQALWNGAWWSTTIELYTCMLVWVTWIHSQGGEFQKVMKFYFPVLKMESFKIE